MSFNQGIPGPATLINSSSTLLYGNSASANALSVQQLGAGNVASFRTTTGSTALFVSSAGNVGVGTTSPQYPLDIAGQPRYSIQPVLQATQLGISAGAAAGWYRIASLGQTARAKFRIYTSGGNLQEQVVVTTAWSAAFSGYPTLRIEDQSSATFAGTQPLYNGQVRTVVNVNSNGTWYLEVYLSSVATAYTLYVQLIEGDASGASITLTSPIVAGSIPTNYTAQPTVPVNAFSVTPFNTTSNVSFLITNTGNVGIGTTSPTDPLTVQALNTQATFADLSQTNPNSKKFSILYQNPGGVGAMYWSTFLGKSLSTDGTNFTIHSDGSNRGMSAIELGYFGVNFYSNVQPSSTTDQTGITPTALQASRVMTVSAISGTAGRVGIGTTNPQRLLHVYTGVSGNVAAFVSGGGGGSYSNVDITSYLNASSVPTVRIAIIDDSAYSGHFTILTKTPGSENNVMNERMRITSAGNVGIGAQSPPSKLWVAGVAGTSGTFGVYQSDVSVNIGFVSGSNNGIIQVYAGGSASAVGTSPYTLEIQTAGGALTLGSASSAVGVGSLAGAGNRAVYSTAAGVLTNSSSDQRLKSNVNELIYGLSTVNNLRPVSYNWSNTESLGSQIEIGFIAQEVQTLVPEVVGQNTNGMLSLDYQKLVPVLTKAIKELSAENTSLKARLDSLEARLAAAGL